MNPSRNDLPEANRVKLTTLLNERLAEAIDLSLQTKQAHWNVKGPNFIALHELFDSLAGIVTGFVDELAERITALGGTAEGTVAAVSGRSKLPAYPLEITSGRDHTNRLADSLAAFGKSARASIELAEQLDDADTADLLTGISRETDKQLWFVEAHLQADR